jgi:hypothetical protein|tara:strand:+ start:279 stop:1415 length:1137 start_codon:yes stop_codon:yes gene_type:complete
MDLITKYLNTVAYKFPKGYPDINNNQDILLLESLISEVIGKKFNLYEVENNSGTKKAVQFIIDELGNKYDFVIKSNKTRLGIAGKKDPQFFLDLFQEAFDEKLDIKIIPKGQSPNPSNSFNMYTFDTKEFGKVNIVVSSKPPGGDGKGNEGDFLDGINQLIEENGGKADIILTSPNNTINYKNITVAIDSSKTGAGKGDKSDVQFLSDNNVEANISIKKDGGFRWASVATPYKDFITKLVNDAIKGNLTDLELKPNPKNEKKYLMYDPKTGERVTKVIIPDFPKDDINNWVFGPEDPQVIIVSKPEKGEYSLKNGTITVKVSHIYKELKDLEEDNIYPVFAIMQHIGMSQGLDYRIIPSKQANITSNVRELSYNEIMN